MKVIVENNVKQFVLDRINKVYIGFDDNVEVSLDQIIDYDIDLDRVDCCSIGFTNAISDVEMINHFKGDNKSKIIYVKIEATGMSISDCRKNDVLYDIPCEMIIRRLRTNGEINNIGNMFVELEGFVK